MHKRLKRELGLLGALCIAAGAMISSGLFVLPGVVFRNTGPALILAYAFASLLVIPSMLSKAELATAMPKSGGSYFFIERSLGALPGMLAGLANWFSIALKAAFALLGIGAFATLVWPGITPFQVKGVAIGCCVLFTLLNLLGVKVVGRIQVALVLVLVSILGVYVAKGIGAVRIENFVGFMPFGLGPVVATAGMVFVSYGGLTKVASVAEEIRNPGRNIPLAMFLAFVVVSVLYISVIFVTVGVVEPLALSVSLTPISEGARIIMGRAGSVALAIAAILAFVTTANSGIAAASRSPMAMSRDGLLPGLLKKIGRVRRTPYISILLTSAFMIGAIAMLSLPNLVKTASTMALLLFALVNVAVIVMREGRVQSYRPTFRSPLYPWVQGVALCAYSFLIWQMGRVPLLTTALFALLGTSWYLVYARPRVTRQSALIHLVERVTSRKLDHSSLESELRKIVLERDEVVQDRFDHLIRDCEVLDIEGPISAQQMFQMVSRTLAPRLGIPSSTLYALFLEREEESGTVVHPGIAIPHVVVEGEHLFDIVPVRCKEGIRFSSSPVPVRIAFVLIGSRDERNYHLRALMAIAHIVQEPDFERKWLQASTVQQLRNILLLSERRRG